MVDNLEALQAISELGSVTHAAKRLHISQPALSKRISTLEEHFKQKMLDRIGRQVRLTPFALRLVERASPVLRDLRALLLEEQGEVSGRLLVTSSSSVLLSWGARLIGGLRRELSNLDIELTSSLTSVGIDRVISGEKTVALVPGYNRNNEELFVDEIIKEPLVIVPAGLRPLKFPPSGGVLRVISVPADAETRKAFEPEIRAASRHWGWRIEIVANFEHFVEIAHAAREGLGHGLVPLGIALALGIPKQKVKLLPKPGLYTSSCFVARKSTMAWQPLQQFHTALKRSAGSLKQRRFDN